MIARVYSVHEVSLNSTFSPDHGVPALTVSAKGMVNSGGWSEPILAPWSYIVPPSDGILSMDFLARPPSPETMVSTGFSEINVSGVFAIPGWVIGVRVHAATSAVEGRIDQPASISHALLATEGLPLPWPFPWFRPHVA